MKVCLFFTSQCLVLLRDVALSSKPAHTRASQCSGTSGSEKHHPTSSLSHRGQLNPTGLLGASWPRARARSLPPCPAVTAGSLPTAGPGQGKAAAPLPAAPPPPRALARFLPVTRRRAAGGRVGLALQRPPSPALKAPSHPPRTRLPGGRKGPRQRSPGGALSGPGSSRPADRAGPGLLGGPADLRAAGGGRAGPGRAGQPQRAVPLAAPRRRARAVAGRRRTYLPLPAPLRQRAAPAPS